jgi:starch-binding outer membrane protein, SusD/RagB family
MNRHIKMMKRMGVGLLAAAALALGPACDSLDSADLNNPSIEALTKNPTRSGILAASTGLVTGHRVQVAQTNGFVSLLGILGRESYNFDKADPRFISEMLEAPSLDSSSPAFGGNLWQQPYQNLRNAFVVLGALDAVDVAALTAAEKDAITGFTKTIQALDFLVVHNTRWTNGGPIDVNRPLTETPAPFKTKEEILAHAATLLDDAAALLAAHDEPFPFPLGNGFKGFDETTTFLQFNRGLRARVAVYQQDWAAAEAALGASFLDATSPATVESLAVGVYHAYGTGSGDVVNNLVSPNILANERLVTEAEAGDLRVQRKLRRLLDSSGNPTTQTARNLTTGYAFSIYPTNTTPISILRNEDLILLRAETRFRRGNTMGANQDINLIRASAGLAPVAETTDENTFVTELLKQRRYSMLFEGGHRWIDLRRLNRLTDPAIKDIATHNIHVMFPVPLAECLARGPSDPSIQGKCLF